LIRHHRVAVLVLVVASLSQVGLSAQQPERWERELAAFDAADKISPPPPGEVVFVGSSSIQRWDLDKYFPDVKTINRGIGGSELGDTVRLVDRLVIAYAPRLVVVYAGDNDIADGRTSEEVEVQFERLVSAIHAKLPRTRIVFIGLKPSILRWSEVDRMRAANAMIRSYCAHDDLVAYLDIDGAMLGWDEKPRRELFAADGLHLDAEGYELWSILLRPFVNDLGLPATALSYAGDSTK
jgi:lysophospholipase L1-like esterase